MCMFVWKYQEERLLARGQNNKFEGFGILSITL